MDGLILGIQFFTRIPIKKEISFNDKNIGNSLFYLPFIGLIIGLISALPMIFLQGTSKPMASLLTLIILLFLTGGLHLDGLADTFDGFLSGRKQERIMEIMRDSTLGVFGAIALILIILSKYLVLYELPINGWIGIVFSLANARLVVAYIIISKENARNEGLGVLFKKSSGRIKVLYSGVIYSIILVYFNPLYLIPLIGSIIVGELMSLWAYKKINGLTGDVYGAIIEICEVTSLIIFWGVTVWI